MSQIFPLAEAYLAVRAATSLANQRRRTYCLVDAGLGRIAVVPQGEARGRVLETCHPVAPR